MIHVIVGTRAQIIKMAPVMKDLESRGVDYNFIFLAQHKETIYEIIEQFGVKKPDIVIGDMNKDITNVKDMIFWSFYILIYSFFKSKKIFRDDKRGVALIHGDAPPLFLGAFMAKRQGLKVAQIEAGLRSHNYLKPFPEELTRVISAKVGLIDIFFCQDEKAVNNISHLNRTTYCTDYNTILDSLRLAEQSHLTTKHIETNEKFAVVSLHRFETISKKEALEKAVTEIHKITKHVKLFFILHPPTRVSLKKNGLYDGLKNNLKCTLLPRQGFFEFNSLLRKAEFLITDGGSNQEECFYLGIPCLLFRSETERSEGVGENVVISNFDPVVIEEFVSNYRSYRRKDIPKSFSPCRFIVDQLKKFN